MIGGALISVVLLLLAFVGMVVGWRRRGRRQADLTLPASGPIGDPVVTTTGTYLATTFAGRPLDRVVTHGLGFRAAARLMVGTAGVRIDRDGADPLDLPAAALTGAGAATWTIDRATEPEGLTVLGWTFERAGAPVTVESSFRLDAEPRAELIAAVRRLVADQEEDSRADP